MFHIFFNTILFRPLIIDDDSDVEMLQEDQDLIFMSAEPPKKSRSETPGTSGTQQGQTSQQVQTGQQVQIGHQLHGVPQVQTGQLVQIGQQGGQIPQYMYSVPIVDPKTGNIVTGLVPLTSEKGLPQVSPSISPSVLPGRPPSVTPKVPQTSHSKRGNSRYPMSARPTSIGTPNIPLTTTTCAGKKSPNQSTASPLARKSTSAVTSGSLISLEKTVKNIEPTPENDPSLKIADDLFCHICCCIYQSESKFLAHIDSCWPKDLDSESKQSTSDSVIEMLSRIKRDIPAKFKNLFKRPPASYSLSETQAKTLAVNNVLYVMKQENFKACPICYYSTEKMKEDHPRSQSKSTFVKKP